MSSHLKSFIFQNKEEKYSDVALGPPLRSLEPQFMCPEFFRLCYFISSHSNHMKQMIAPILQGEKTGGVFTFVPPALQGLHGYKCAPEMGPGDPAEVSVWSQHQESATRTIQPQSLPSTGPCPHRLPPWADDLSSLLGDRCPSALMPWLCFHRGSQPSRASQAFVVASQGACEVLDAVVAPCCQECSETGASEHPPLHTCLATCPAALPLQAGSLWSQSSDFFMRN